MGSPDDWSGILGIISWFVFLAGSWIFHRKIRNKHTFRFFASAFAITMWSPVLAISEPVIFSYPSTPLLNFIFITINNIVPAALGLMVAIYFLLSARSIVYKPSVSRKKIFDEPAGSIMQADHAHGPTELPE